MNKLNTKHRTPSFAIAIDSQPDPKLTRRFLVLIPANSDFTPATRRISDLANTCGADVLFLGLCNDEAQELKLRREWVTLSALLQDARVSAEARIEMGMNWVDFIKSNYRAGDMIVCLAEQRAGLFHRPLSQILESNMDVPTYILSGLYGESHSRSNWLAEVIVWTGSIGIVAGFFLLQIQITALLQDGPQTALLILSVIAEAWLIKVWNSLFG
jgi:hypothetical protein